MSHIEIDFSFILSCFPDIVEFYYSVDVTNLCKLKIIGYHKLIDFIPVINNCKSLRVLIANVQNFCNKGDNDLQIQSLKRLNQSVLFNLTTFHLTHDGSFDDHDSIFLNEVSENFTSLNDLSVFLASPDEYCCTNIALLLKKNPKLQKLSLQFAEPTSSLFEALVSPNNEILCEISILCRNTLFFVPKDLLQLIIKYPNLAYLFVRNILKRDDFSFVFKNDSFGRSIKFRCQTQTVDDVLQENYLLQLFDSISFNNTIQLQNFKVSDRILKLIAEKSADLFYIFLINCGQGYTLNIGIEALKFIPNLKKILLVNCAEFDLGFC